MRVPCSWLADFVDLPDDLEALTRTLDELGLVVEGVEIIGEGLADVVVARVDEIHAIEGADKIRRIVVEAGDGPLEIVCGAWNFSVGDHVPLAPVGAVLPGGFTIAQRTMRGVTSHGMLCSGRELGLSEDHEGLLVLAGDDLVPGAPLTATLGIEPDVVLDISPEGNRPDAWSVEGVARDLAAVWRQELRRPALASADGGADGSVTVRIDDPTICGMFSAAVLREVTVTSSPSWMVRRLAAAGQRAVNNVVDASNYVMLELGQPTHPYDLARVGGGRLSVRRARPGEPLALLDGSTLELGRPGRSLGDTGVDAVIVDGSDVAVGLAGVMGGASSMIGPDTTTVLLEAAFFDPMTVARTAKRYGLRTEASSRFERGVDPALSPRAIARFVELLRATSPSLTWSTVAPATGQVPTVPTVVVSEEHIEGLLGTLVPITEAAEHLRAIGFTVEVTGRDAEVTPPTSRLDVRGGVAGRADVIEEVARLHGYRRLARATPTWVQAGAMTARQRERRRVREAVVGLGFLEAWTNSFLSDTDVDLVSDSPLRVRVANPLSSTENVLRGSLLVGLARAWGHNVERGVGDVGLFEMGVVVDHPGWTDEPRLSRGGEGGRDKLELPVEHEMLLVVLGRRDDDATTAVATFSALAERWSLADVVVASAPAPRGWHPTRCADLLDRERGTRLGRVGELEPSLVRLVAPSAAPHQRVGLLEVDLDLLFDPTKVVRRVPSAAVPSRFPPGKIDLAFSVPRTVRAADVAYALRTADELVERVVLFDVFAPDGPTSPTRSLAFAVTLSADDRTLSDAEIARSRERLIEAAQGVGAHLR